jgi:hypothetical protein
MVPDRGRSLAAQANPHRRQQIARTNCVRIRPSVALRVRTSFGLAEPRW